MTDKPEDFPKLTAKQLRQKRQQSRAERTEYQKQAEFWKGANEWFERTWKGKA